MVVNHDVQAVEHAETQAVDDVDEDVEHHALQSLRASAQQRLLDNGETVEAARHQHEENRRSGVDDEDEREQKLPRGPKI